MTRLSRRIGALALVWAGLAATSVTAMTSVSRPAAATPGAGVFLLGDSVTESLSIGSPSTFAATITPAYPDAVIDGRSNRRTVTASTYLGQPVTSGLDEITSQDVPTVLWSMMSTLNRPEYASCNTALTAATKRWPTLRLIDWDGYSHAHPEWFADD